MWVAHDIRDQVVDFVTYWSDCTGIVSGHFIRWLGISTSKFYDWKTRYGKVNEHNGWVPRDFWLEDWEKEAIKVYFNDHPNDGYRRLTFMMLDDNIVAVSPSSVYRVLKEAGLLRKWSGRASGKGDGFNQPDCPHEHWHTDISYLNICGTFYYLCSVLDGYSRFIVHWEIRERMLEKDVEIVIQRALEKYPSEHPRIISDNGPQYIARDFKEFIRVSGLSHVKTAPYYPQSNGKLERWHQSLKQECIRPKTPLSLEDARNVVGNFVDYYNMARLHSSLGYITPADKLAGREKAIFRQRDEKLECSREQRKANRARMRAAKEKKHLTERSNSVKKNVSGETEVSSAEEQLTKG